VSTAGDLNMAFAEWYKYRSGVFVGNPKISSNSDMLVTTSGSYTGPCAANPTIRIFVPVFSFLVDESVSLISTPGLLIVRLPAIYIEIFMQGIRKCIVKFT
jgi:hypothetical protein